MPIDRRLRNPFSTSTKLGKAVARNRASLEKIGLRTFLDLRKALATDRLPSSGIDPEDLKTLKAFAALARVFPPHVALSLVEHGISDLRALSRWREEQFKEALNKTGDDADNVVQQKRFVRFQKLASRTGRPEALNGLQVDLGEDFALVDRHAAELTRNGVESLTDWAYLRNQLKLDESLRQLLDAYTRLSRFGLDPNTIKHLLSNQIDSAAILARQTDEKLKQIANSGGIQPDALISAQQLALSLLDELVLDVDNGLPGWDLSLVYGRDRATIAPTTSRSFRSLPTTSTSSARRRSRSTFWRTRYSRISRESLPLMKIRA